MLAVEEKFKQDSQFRCEADETGALRTCMLASLVVLLASPASLDTSVPLDPKLDLSTSTSTSAV